MRKIFVFLLVLQTIFVHAQKAGDEYAFSSNYLLVHRLDPFTKTYNDPADTTSFAMRGQIFVIQSSITIDGTAGYCIIFWDFKSTRNGRQQQVQPLLARAIAHVIDKTDNGRTFFVAASDMKDNATADFNKPHGLLSLDGIVLPVKLRFRTKQPGGDFDFLQSVSIGPAVAKQWNYGGAFGKTSISIMAGFNVTSISVDSSTAPGAVTSKATLLGLTPFGGFNYTYAGISFSLLAGWDILTGKAERVWAYRKSPWLGIGIGTSILSSKTKQQ